MFKEFVGFTRDLFKSNEFIPLHAPNFGGNEQKYVAETIESTFVSSVGQFVNDFEEAIAKYTNSQRAIAVSNGTSALHLTLVHAGVDRECEVITQALSFVATANSIAYTGASPVFIDVDTETLGMSPDSLRHFLETNADVENDRCINRQSGKEIKACVPMHTFGHPCRIDEIKAICDEYHIVLIEDAAESIGSFYKNAHTGTFGSYGCFSFNGNKTITSGGGGAIISSTDKAGQELKHLSTTAKVPHAWKYEHDRIAYNYRMPNLNAALALAQLERLEVFIASKRDTAHQYKTFFESYADCSFVEEPSGARSNYWLNAVLMENLEMRDEFLKFSNDMGVMTRPVWELLNTLEMFNHCQSDDLTNSKQLASRLVNIPSSYKQ